MWGKRLREYSLTEHVNRCLVSGDICAESTAVRNKNKWPQTLSGVDMLFTLEISRLLAKSLKTEKKNMLHVRPNRRFTNSLQKFISLSLVFFCVYARVSACVHLRMRARNVVFAFYRKIKVVKKYSSFMCALCECVWTRTRE